jgi:hypothetical protein
LGYKEIADKRRQAIDSMEQACEIGLQDGQEMQEFINLYFRSKYARKEYLPSDTSEGLYFDFSIVEKYIGFVRTPPDGMGGERDNLEHLRGACTRLLVGSPNNGALLLLNSFAILLLESQVKRKKLRIVNERLFNTAKKDFIRGFSVFASDKGLSDEELNVYADSFQARITDFNKLLKPVIAELISTLRIAIHTHWLAAFNHRFDDRTQTKSLSDYL